MTPEVRRLKNHISHREEFEAEALDAAMERFIKKIVAIDLVNLDGEEYGQKLRVPRERLQDLHGWIEKRIVLI